MSIQLHDDSDGVVEIELAGRLAGDDFQSTAPRLERIIHERGKVRMMCQMHDFHGWTPSALWKDARFTLRHRKDVERVALVGETRWQRWMGQACKSLTPAEVAYFDRDQADDARIWVRQLG